MCAWEEELSTSISALTLDLYVGSCVYCRAGSGWHFGTSMSVVFTQLLLLLWKNFTYRRRQTVSVAAGTVEKKWWKSHSSWTFARLFSRPHSWSIPVQWSIQQSHIWFVISTAEWSVLKLNQSVKRLISHLHNWAESWLAIKHTLNQGHRWYITNDQLISYTDYG